ncbi:MAG: hypothetical protein CMP49_00445 [Flavobacteriales bacterium]|jgi:hypothetical protein|nr:hypothetical protein [Flavobacteriales bacterium]|tara:strand:+ start:1953 stop:3572 length:1620 start_codon:yes stop_codon:yes gene_type:complete
MKKIILFSFISYLSFGQTNEITFTEDISPIIYNNCTSCHRPGEAGPMSFTSYPEVAAMADMIKEVTQNNYMPPWPPDPSYTNHALLDQRYLTEEEKMLISDWVDQGYPEGDPSLEASIPDFPSGSAIGEPDYVFEMESEYYIEGNNMDDYRVFVFPTGFTEDTYIKSIEFRPDNREAVHHAIMMIDVTGTAAQLDAESPNVLGYESFGGFSLDGVSPNDYVFLGGYAPGMNPIVWNGELGMKIPAGADLLCQIHYAPSSIDEWDKSSINIFTKPASEVQREVQMKMWLRLDLDIQANTQTELEACLNFSNSFLDMFGPSEIYQFGQPTGLYGEQNCELPEAWSLLGILPHSHLMGKSWEVYAETPNGETLPIIKIPDWDFDWQGFYYPEYMQHIPAGSRIEAIAKYDNTNDFNMSWGELTTDEMFFCPIYYVPYEEGDEDIYLGISEETSISENINSYVDIFPNPVNSEITITHNFKNFSKLLLKIYDCQGRQILDILDENFQSEPNSIKLDVERLKTGTYFINLQSDDQSATHCFIKE